MELDVEMLGKLAVASPFAGGFFWLVYTVGMRLVAALDRVATKVDDHTKADVASHAEMRQDIQRIGTWVEAATATQAAANVPVEVEGEPSVRYARPRTGPGQHR